MPIVLQDRDIGLLRDLFESRVMSLGHIATIHFEGRQEAAKKRVQRLKAEGLLRERLRRIGEASVLYLGKPGFLYLRDKGILDQYPRMSMVAMERRAQVSSLTIRHELEVMDIKAAFVSAVRARSDLRLISFSTWPALNEFSVARNSRDPFANEEMVVKPDGFIRLWVDTEDSTVEHCFFLEVDRSTEVQEVLVKRVAAYANFYRSGGFAERMGGDRKIPASFPFRVLMVFKTEERRNNTAMRLLQGSPPVLTQAWLTTSAELINEPFGPIWIQPTSIAESSLDSAFRTIEKRGLAAYRNQAVRDELIQVNVARHCLLE